jgi:hypothetical protein
VVGAGVEPMGGGGRGEVNGFVLERRSTWRGELPAFICVSLLRNCGLRL